MDEDQRDRRMTRRDEVRDVGVLYRVGAVRIMDVVVRVARDSHAARLVVADFDRSATDIEAAHGLERDCVIHAGIRGQRAVSTLRPATRPNARHSAMLPPPDG